MGIIPVHAGVHTDDQLLVGTQIRKALGPSIAVGHIAQRLTRQAGHHKLVRTQHECLAGISINTIAALLGFAPGECGIDQSLMRYQPVDVAGLGGIIRVLF